MLANIILILLDYDLSDSSSLFVIVPQKILMSLVATGTALKNLQGLRLLVWPLLET